MQKQLTPQVSRRPYNSPMRRRQAEETRRRILDKARTLFRTSGYTGTTIDAVAQAAGISPKTVTALFSSKRELLAALVEITEFGPTFQETRDKLAGKLTPHQRIALAARLNRQAYETLTEQGFSPSQAAVVVPQAVRRLWREPNVWCSCFNV